MGVLRREHFLLRMADVMAYGNEVFIHVTITFFMFAGTL